jgi:hypothetical protein
MLGHLQRVRTRQSFDLRLIKRLDMTTRGFGASPFTTFDSPPSPLRTVLSGSGNKRRNSNASFDGFHSLMRELK